MSLQGRVGPNHWPTGQVSLFALFVVVEKRKTACVAHAWLFLPTDPARP